MLKRNFLIAAATVGLCPAQWADLHGFSRPLVANVLNGKITSARVRGMMEAFIAERFAALREELSAAA